MPWNSCIIPCRRDSVDITAVGVVPDAYRHRGSSGVEGRRAAPRVSISSVGHGSAVLIEGKSLVNQTDVSPFLYEDVILFRRATKVVRVCLAEWTAN